MTSYYKEASMSELILQFAFTYTDDNRPKLNNFKEMMELADYLVKQNTVEKFVSYADKRGLKRRNLMIRKSHKLLERYINSRIIYNMLDEGAWNEYINLDDPTIAAALKVFKNKAAFPQKPVQPEAKVNSKSQRKEIKLTPPSHHTHEQTRVKTRDKTTEATFHQTTTGGDVASSH